MERSTNSLIQQMADDLEPVRPLLMRDGILLVVAAVALTLLGVALLPGLWRGLWMGDASMFFVVTNGLLLVLGCAAASSVLQMANPRVGNQHDGPRWASLMVAVLPVAAIVSLLGHEHPMEPLTDTHGFKCFGAAMLASLLTAVTLVLWLRRGAPVAPATAGMHLGIAATALGSASYGLACPLDGAVHLGVWHVAPVLLGALLGRFALPPLLRW
jgi:hypothetical protein